MQHPHLLRMKINTDGQIVSKSWKQPLPSLSLTCVLLKMQCSTRKQEVYFCSYCGCENRSTLHQRTNSCGVEPSTAHTILWGLKCYFFFQCQLRCYSFLTRYIQSRTFFSLLGFSYTCYYEVLICAHTLELKKSNQYFY